MSSQKLKKLPNLSYWKILLLFFWMLGPETFASNFHEHISTVPNYQDYKFAFEKIGRPLPSLLVADISETPSGAMSDIFGFEMTRTLGLQFGISIETFDQALMNQLDVFLKALTVQELTSKIAVELTKKLQKPVNSEEVLRSLFEFTTLNKRGDRPYLSIGWDVRIEAQDYLRNSGEGVFHLFEHFLKRVPIKDRQVMSITANGFRDFFDEKNSSIMLRLQELFLKNGTHLEWMAGFIRKQFETATAEKFDQGLNDFQSILRRGQVDGIDITGSIVEASPKHRDITDNNEALFADRLRRMIEMLGDPQNGPAQLKIHMYETTPEGDFYRLLFDVIDQIGTRQKPFPPIFRIAHINAVRSEDIEQFKKLRQKYGIKFVFEANIDSNMSVKDAKIEHLAQTINKLVKNGFDVRLGTDGMGIFGESSYFTQAFKRLKRTGLSKEARKHLLSFSFKPLQESHFSKSFRGKMQCRQLFQ